jgi:serine phosphatase RsbU (regulator of sigma subunit)/pSer/pThr/pTyr-binding forkhead associated (FHA) protein
MAILTSTDPKVIQRRVVLKRQPCVIGRHPDCEIQIDDGSVSRRHAQISYADGNYYVEDLQSRNGTFLNDQQVFQTTKLYDESEIRICDTSFFFRLSESSPAQFRYGAPTAEQDNSSFHLATDSVMLEDDLDGRGSRVMSSLESPSHHSKTHNRVSAEEKLATLTKITYALSESVERNQVLTSILDFLFELFVEADRGFIILKGADGRLQPLGFKSRRSGSDEHVRVSRTIVNQVMQTKTAIMSTDASMDDRFDMAQSMVEIRIRSIMCAPLINSQDVSIGVIQLDTLKQSIAFKEEDLETLVTVAMQASLAIQKADLFEDVKKNADLKTDLALAHELQQRFLPQRPPSCSEYEFFSHYRPMLQVGGDYFDYIPLEDDRLAVITADVVGHGVAAALLMAKVSAESRFALATSKSATQAIHMMNNNLSDLNIDRFVTLALCLINQRNHRLTFVNAGHMAPIIRRANGAIEELANEQSGLPLGIMEDYPYESVEVDFHPGDVLIMYTDGVNEAMNEKSEQLTTDAMISEIKHSQAKTPLAIGELLLETVNRHIGDVPPIDDMCIVCMGRKS